MQIDLKDFIVLKSAGFIQVFYFLFYFQVLSYTANMIFKWFMSLKYKNVLEIFANLLKINLKSEKKYSDP